jgi:hypothetical protein
MARAAFVLASLLAGAAGAQPAGARPAQEHVRGDVVTVRGDTLTIKKNTGETLALILAPDARVSVADRAELSDVHEGAFIGTTALPEPDGSLRAVEVHLFPESMRGTGEGHRPWDRQPGSTMTNATVAPSTSLSRTNATVADVEGRSLRLTYPGGEKTVLVPHGTTVVKLEPSDRSRLVPGAHVFVIASRQPDGRLRAERLTVGKGGVVPPM